MSSLLQAAETREINGRSYSIRPLSFAESRKVFGLLGKYMAAYSPGANMGEDDLGPTLSLHSAGMLTDDNLDKLVSIFGKTSTVEVASDRVLALDTDERRSIAFGGRYGDVYGWLDECMRVSFSDVIAKMAGALKRAQERAQKETGENS